MKDYSAMSDFEINKAVAIHLGMKPFDEKTGWQGLTKEPYVEVIVSGAGRLGAFSPCNQPADAWPIIMANKISLMFDRSLEDGCNAEWCLASSPCDQIIVDHVMPDKILRAAMIVFLKMKESSHA